MNILIKKVRPNAIMPEYKTLGASGFDVSACIESDLAIAPKSFALVPTGLAIEMPLGFEAQVRSRSGLALKNGIFVLNSPGTIDNDYRGEISVILANFSENSFIVTHGMRIAQVVVGQYHQFDFQVVENLSDTDRGDGGFGSTGI